MNPVIELLSLPARDADLEALATLLLDGVAGGASLGFMADLSRPEARAYWAKIVADAAVGPKRLLVARAPGGGIVGSVQLTPETRANGRHRAEVQKLLVLRPWRKRGTGRALMAAVEAEARRLDLALLFLDTSEGPGGARAFYERLGYTVCGGIPDYALDPDGTPRVNVIFCKRLRVLPSPG